MNDNAASSSRPKFPYRRWGVLLALLVGELCAISLRYDAATVPETRPWHGLVRHAGELSRIGLAVTLAVLLLAGPGCFRELMRRSWPPEHPRRWFLFLLGNLLAFLCFFETSAFVLEGVETSSRFDWPFLAIWLASGTATLVFWAMAVLPADLWIRLLEQSWRGIVAGSVLGVVAFTAGLLARDQWNLLSKATLQVVRGLLGLVYSNLVYDPAINSIGTATFHVEITPECSGYEGVGLMAGLLAVALWALRRDFRFPRALVLLPVAITLAWLANALRIAALVVLGNSGYPDLALGGFHSLAGWVLFLGVGLGLIAAALRSPFFSQIPAEGPHASGPAFDAAYLVPAMTLIAISMVTATLSPGVDHYYPVRVIAVAIAFAVYRKHYDELRLKWSWFAVGIGCGVFAFWVALERYGSTPLTDGVVRSSLESIPQGWAIAWVVFRVLGSVIMVPVAEELAFRGYLTRRLISADFRSVPPGQLTWVSILVTSLLFGVLHGRWFAGTLAGVAYALVYRRRGELTDAVVAHAVTNGLIAIAVLATGAWSLWA